MGPGLTISLGVSPSNAQPDGPLPDGRWIWPSLVPTAARKALRTNAKRALFEQAALTRIDAAPEDAPGAGLQDRAPAFIFSFFS